MSDAARAAAAVDRCVAAAAAWDAVGRERVAAASAAVEAGATKTAVAETLGVTRQTLDRWLGLWSPPSRRASH